MEEMPAAPKVSIGMPVFNGEQFIRGALDSLLKQSFSDFELIISDNASTDGTERICREYAARDKRIRYVRQPTNLGAAANFKFVLDEARGEYFMWAADDDIRSADFLEEAVRLLDSRQDCVAATTPDRMEGESVIRDFALTGTMWDRFRAFMRHCWVSHGIFYSLARAHIVRGFDFSLFHTLGGDWLYNIYLASQGNVCRALHGLTVFSNTGTSNSDARWSYARKKSIHWLLPFHEFSKFAWGLSETLPIPQRFRLLLLLCKLNARSARAQLRHEVLLKSRKSNT